MFAYAANNPLRYIDPDGRQACGLIDIQDFNKKLDLVLKSLPGLAGVTETALKTTVISLAKISQSPLTPARIFSLLLSFFHLVSKSSSVFISSHQHSIPRTNLFNSNIVLFDVYGEYRLGLGATQYAAYVTDLTSVLKYETLAGVEGVDRGVIANAYGVPANYKTTTVDDLNKRIADLVEPISNVEIIVKNIEYQPQLYAWLYCMGYGQEVDMMRKRDDDE